MPRINVKVAMMEAGIATAAINTAFQTHFPEHLDVMGFNYNLNEHDPYHKLHPKQPSVGSETASTVCTRGIYSTDKLRNWVSAYDAERPPWAHFPVHGPAGMPQPEAFPRINQRSFEHEEISRDAGCRGCGRRSWWRQKPFRSRRAISC